MRVALMAAVALLAGASGPALLASGAGVHFVVLGDTGTGGAGQHRVADAVARVCAARGCDFALVAGDNIYDNGVSSAYDPQFEQKFEVPYAGLGFPFHMALGNHDNGGTVGEGDGSENFKGDFQVQYHYRTDRASDKWRMPARYYTFRAGDAQFWALDTNPLMYFGGLPLPGEPVWTGLDPLGAQQLQWLRGSLDASDARWRFAFAHHPYISNGQHGDAGSYEDVPGLGANVKLLVEQALCGRVDAYFAGHDHDLQWLRPTEACGDTFFLVSGAGSKTRPLAGEAHPAWFQRGGTLGFAWVGLDEGFRAAFYDGDGNLLFEQALPQAP